jgi:hypothetical protein
MVVAHLAAPCFTQNLGFFFVSDVTAHNPDVYAFWLL